MEIFRRQGECAYKDILLRTIARQPVIMAIPLHHVKYELFPVIIQRPYYRLYLFSYIVINCSYIVLQ